MSLERPAGGEGGDGGCARQGRTHVFFFLSHLYRSAREDRVVCVYLVLSGGCGLVCFEEGNVCGGSFFVVMI